MKKNIALIIGYVLGILISICGCYYISSGFQLLCFISFGICFYRLINHITKLDSAPSLFITLFMISLITLVLIFLDKKQIKKEFNEYGSVVTLAIIDNIYNYKYDHSIDIHYKTLSDITIRVNKICGEEISKVKNVGDTILIRYSKLSHNKYKVFNYFPTREEIQEYKNGKSYESKKQKK